MAPLGEKEARPECARGEVSLSDGVPEPASHMPSDRLIPGVGF